jgi:hypothetical protein
MNRNSQKRVLRQVGLSSAVAATVLVTSVGVASATTHSARPATAPAARTSNFTGPNAPLLRLRVPGTNGDVTEVTDTSITLKNFDGTTMSFAINSATMVTDHRRSASTSDLALGEEALVVVNPADSAAAGSITIVSAHANSAWPDGAGPRWKSAGLPAVVSPERENDARTTRGAVAHNRTPE